MKKSRASIDYKVSGGVMGESQGFNPPTLCSELDGQPGLGHLTQRPHLRVTLTSKSTLNPEDGGDTDRGLQDTCLTWGAGGMEGHRATLRCLMGCLAELVVYFRAAPKAGHKPVGAWGKEVGRLHEAQ